jgi:hypothetical protein
MKDGNDMLKVIVKLDTKEIMSVYREGVCISDTEIMLIYLHFKFNLLTKYHSI